MKTKTRAFSRFEIKAVSEEARTFEGLASTWDQDSGGDVIEKGAFTNTLAEWKSNPTSIIPLINQHRYYDVRDVIGKMTEGDETAEGLQATFQIVEGADGDSILSRIKGGFINSLSIGYEATKWETEKPEGARYEWDYIRHLTEIKLYEVSLVIWPMNTNALIDLSTVKSAVLAAKSHNGDMTDADLLELKRSHAQLGEVITEIENRKGIAVNDPRRIALEEQTREIFIRSLVAAQ